MAKPNYQFEKRQRDLAKKKKKEEKRLQKLAVNAAGSEQAAAQAPETVPNDEANPPHGAAAPEA